MTTENDYSNADSPMAPGYGHGASDIAGGAEIGGKRKWDPKGRRNLIIVGSVLTAAVLLIVLMFAGGSSEQVIPSYIPPPGTSNAGGSLGTEDRMAIRADERQRLDSARVSGMSAVENLIDEPGVMPNDQPREAPLPAATPQVGSPIQGYGTTSTAQQAPGFDENRMKGFTDQLATQMASWGLTANSASKDNDRTYIRTVQASKALPGAGSGSGSGAGSEEPGKEDQVLAKAFEDVYAAEIATSFDSDTPGLVRARILTGPLEGAVVKGSGKKLGEGVQLAFSDMSYKGRAIKITAIALDEQTSTDIVHGRYNGRYVQRFVFPILADGLSAYGQARSQTGTQVVLVNTPNGSGAVGAQQQPPPSATQARYAMQAAAIDTAGKLLTPSGVTDQVVLEAPKTIGLMFLEPVMASDLSKNNRN